jgi:N-acetyl-gamma-glutamyl-phosphate reductase
MVRGIFATIRVTPTDPALDVAALYRDACAREPFLRWRVGSPRVAEVAGTNFADLAVRVVGDATVVLVAIDNLGKGMAGQAVQNLNRLFGLDETTGLMFPGGRP